MAEIRENADPSSTKIQKIITRLMNIDQEIIGRNQEIHRLMDNIERDAARYTGTNAYAEKVRDYWNRLDGHTKNCKTLEGVSTGVRLVTKFKRVAHCTLKDRGVCELNGMLICWTSGVLPGNTQVTARLGEWSDHVTAPPMATVIYRPFQNQLVRSRRLATNCNVT